MRAKGLEGGGGGGAQQVLDLRFSYFVALPPRNKCFHIRTSESYKIGVTTSVRFTLSKAPLFL